MNDHTISRKELLRMAIVRYVGGFLALAAIFFIPAGTLDYWQAWVYLAILFIPMFFVLLYLLRNDPDLLERRFRMREKEQTQKKIIGFSWLIFLVAFVLPGLDRRFGWSAGAGVGGAGSRYCRAAGLCHCLPGVPPEFLCLAGDGGGKSSSR